MYRILLSISLLFVLITHCFGQQANPDLIDQKMTRQFNKALQYQKKGENLKAIKLFNKILKKKPDHINSMLQLAGIYYGMEENHLAESYLTNAIAIDSTYDPEMYFSLALVQEKQSKRTLAGSNYRRYVRFLPDQQTRKTKLAAERARQLDFIVWSMQNPVPFEPLNLGKAINTEAHEYLASVNVSNELMIFSRRHHRQEDLYSSRNVDGVWTDVSPLKELNTPGNEAAHCLSPDGKTLIFTSCDRRDGYGSCDLYESRFINGSWTKSDNLGPTINSSSWDSQPCLSWDGNTLYFTSSRSGGHGGRDIWFSRKNSEGKWTMPENIGDGINTRSNEESPFIHPNDHTMYFMSNGHLGMGGTDLFVSQKENGEWTKPLNLGYPINTEGDEGALRVASDGITAYFSTDNTELTRQNNRNLDIFSFKLYPKISAIPVSYVKGKVVNRENQEAVEAQIILKNNKTSELINALSSDEQGNFLTVLPLGETYNFTIIKPGFVFYSDHFDLTDKALKHFDLYIELTPVKKDTDTAGPDQTFVLKNIFFESGSSKIDLSKSEIEFNNLISFLGQNDKIRIRINGHTDSTGTDEDNMTLSLERSKAVYDELIKRGVSVNRLQYMGFGETKPIATNETKEGRQLNRRTEFIILEK